MLQTWSAGQTNLSPLAIGKNNRRRWLSWSRRSRSFRDRNWTAITIAERIRRFWRASARAEIGGNRADHWTIYLQSSRRIGGSERFRKKMSDIAGGRGCLAAADSRHGKSAASMSANKSVSITGGWTDCGRKISLVPRVRARSAPTARRPPFVLRSIPTASLQVPSRSRLCRWDDADRRV